MGGWANAPASVKKWRPSHLPAGETLVLTAEASPNSAGYNDGIVATPSHSKSLIIGRVKIDASQALAPLMRSKSVRVKAHFDEDKFNLRSWFMEIDVFGVDATAIDKKISQYVLISCDSTLTCTLESR